MKKRIFVLAKKLGIEITGFKTYRSDFGCQVYEIHFSDRGEFSDSYFIGDPLGRKYIIEMVKAHMMCPKGLSPDYAAALKSIEG